MYTDTCIRLVERLTGPDIFEITSQWMAQLSDWHS